MRTDIPEVRWPSNDYTAGFDHETDEYLLVCRRLRATQSAVDALLGSLVERDLPLRVMRGTLPPGSRIPARWLDKQDWFSGLTQREGRALSDRYFLVQQSFRKYQSGVGVDLQEVIDLLDYHSYVSARIKKARRLQVLLVLSSERKAFLDSVLPYSWRDLIQANKLVGRAYTLHQRKNAQRSPRVIPESQSSINPGPRRRPRLAFSE